MVGWKRPENYIADENICCFDVREKVGCTEKFRESGLLKNGRWDYFAQYQMLCKNCPYFLHDIGVYFGEGKHTNGIEEKEAVICRCKITTQEQLDAFASVVSKGVKAILLDDVRVENLSVLQKFPMLECVLISYSPKLGALWDVSFTPNLAVLRYTGNKHLTDISAIAKAENLEYFEIDILTSQTYLNYVQSFAPLSGLKRLKEIVLRGVMSQDDDINPLIQVENLEKIWISPNTFSTENFAKFEALKFTIFDECGIFQNGDFSCPLGKGQRGFRSEEAKAKFQKAYAEKMAAWRI